MEFNNKKLKRTSTIINRLISVILCVFLIGLTSTILDDLDPYSARPQQEDFINQTKIDLVQGKIDSIYLIVEQKDEKLEQINTTLSLAKKEHQNAKESFNNWIKTRKNATLGQSDQKIQKRINKLDLLLENQQKIETTKSGLLAEKNKLLKQSQAYRDEISKINTEAYDLQFKAQKSHDLKVFLYRLLFILPILALGIFFFLKKRKHKYSPIFIGFTFYSVYAFFFGLVPYLPSYGGYIRYVIGIVLCIVLGKYVINRFRKFVETKKKELEKPSGDRAKKIQLDSAENALEKHLCPSCGKDFLLKTWHPGKGKTNSQFTFTPSKHCRFCGLQLFASCNSCETENFIHLPFCSTCGDKTTVSE